MEELCEAVQPLLVEVTVSNGRIDCSALAQDLEQATAKARQCSAAREVSLQGPPGSSGLQMIEKARCVPTRVMVLAQVLPRVMVLAQVLTRVMVMAQVLVRGMALSQVLTRVMVLVLADSSAISRPGYDASDAPYYMHSI